MAIFGDNNSKIVTYGNWAENNGTAESVTGGQVLGHVVDANGNVFQLEFFEGNVVNPQFALFGDNTSEIFTQGNVAKNNGGDTSGALAFIDANGNVVQVMILSHNVINPQVSVGGSNTVDIYSGGNLAEGNGGDVAGIAGFFTITKVGNVTQIAILSNNVWAPQLVLPDFHGRGGSNTADIIVETNTAEADGIDVDLPPNPPPGRIDVGNIHQWAPFGNGNIINQQWNLAHQTSTPDVVVEDPPPPPPEVTPSFTGNIIDGEDGGEDEVVDSFKAEPGVILADGTGGPNGPGGPNGAHNWKPGDGAKKVIAGVKKFANDVHNALHPKPNEAPASDPAPTP